MTKNSLHSIEDFIEPEWPAPECVKAFTTLRTADILNLNKKLNLPAATYAAALSVIICTTFSTPASMITFSNIKANVGAFFTLLEVSTDFQNTTSSLQATKKLIMVLLLPSVHPSDKMVQPYFFHSFFWSSINTLALPTALSSNLQNLGVIKC